MSDYREVLREVHNELKDMLDSAESAEERAFVRGQRDGVLKAFVEYQHQQKQDHAGMGLTDGAVERIEKSTGEVDLEAGDFEVSSDE